MEDDPFSPFLLAQAERSQPVIKPPRRPRRVKFPDPPPTGPELPDRYAQAAAFLKILAHPLRLEIIALLQELEDTSAGVLEHLTDQPQATIAHHLGILRRAGIVASRPDGIYRSYHLTEPRAIALIRAIVV